jgi:hypothetical protein
MLALSAWCRRAELNRRHTDFQFRLRSLPNLTKTCQLNALCPIWQVGALPNPAKSYQKEMGGKREADFLSVKIPKSIEFAASHIAVWEFALFLP